jgi:hypothetical protein
VVRSDDKVRRNLKELGEVGSGRGLFKLHYSGSLSGWTVRNHGKPES